VDRPLALQEVEAPIISRKLAHGGGKVVSLMHQLPLPPGDIPGTHFCLRLSRLQCHGAARRIMSMKNTNNINENRTPEIRKGTG